MDMGSANYFYIAIISFYAFVLGYLVLYKSYQELGVAYAVQPRYFIMFMPIIATFVVQAASFSIKRSRHKILLMVIGVILLSQGGGMLTYLVSSDDNWFWNGRNITNINESLREAASGFILSAEDVDRNFNK